MSNKNLISIIIPVYNEQNLIKKLLIKVNSIKNLKKEIIVINDGSSDKTLKILKNECNKLYDVLINYSQNKGKGYACRRGIKSASGKIIIIQDGDLEYNPKNYVKLIKPILQKKKQILFMVLEF